jgi:hypothetical protein
MIHYSSWGRGGYTSKYLVRKTNFPEKYTSFQRGGWDVLTRWIVLSMFGHTTNWEKKPFVHRFLKFPEFFLIFAVVFKFP